MKNFEQFKIDLAKLVSFESVLKPQDGNAPFGKESKDVLLAFIDIAEKLGFEVINYDNYGAELSYGEGEEIGIMGHLDIVPIGSGWTFDALTLTENNNKLYGRGVSDDKGPTLLTLYALKDVIDSGIKFNRKIRFFVGCNEEKGWKDLDYIITKTTMPTYGFSPDGNFPLTYSEKGTLKLWSKIPKLKNFAGLTGGTAVNAVCAYAFVTPLKDGVNEELLKKYNLKYNGKIIESFGVPAHGSAPWEGKNAFKPLFDYMIEMGESELIPLLDCLFLDKYKIFDYKNEQGMTTLSADIIIKKDNDDYIVSDIRVPAPFTFKTIEDLFESCGYPHFFIEGHPPVMTEKDGWFVQSLLSAYKSVTGDKNAKPIPMGGSTFARAFKFGCSFGIEGDMSDSGNIHAVDEYLGIDWLNKSYEIYKQAIINLVK